jgi:hypothetical protein
MEHFIDIYKKKTKGPKYCEDLLNLNDIKVNLKVDGKPFQVLYNKDTDELEFHGRSGNETTIGPIIDDYTRLFSKPVNDAIEHIEPRKDIFKRYKFLTFEVINNMLLLTAVVDKDDNFINDATEIKSIADMLETDVMPTLWEGPLNQEQKDSIIQILGTGLVPEKEYFIKWVKEMFGTYKNYPSKLISASDEFIEGIVFFFTEGDVVTEYKMVDPTYRQSMKDRDAKHAAEREKLADKYEECYTIMTDWLEKNASSLDSNHIVSMQKNFINMYQSEKINRLLDLASNFADNESETYRVQINRVLPEIQTILDDYKNSNAYKLFELFMKTYYKGKKRAFIISPEFQKRINSIVLKMKNVNENINSLYLIKNFTDLYEELCTYDCILTLNNKVLYEGKITDSIFEKFTDNRTVCKFIIPNDKTYICLLHENDTVNKLQKLLENNSLDNYITHNKAMYLANNLPVYGILNECEIDDKTKSNIKKFGINYKRIIENIICNNIVTE